MCGRRPQAFEHSSPLQGVFGTFPKEPSPIKSTTFVHNSISRHFQIKVSFHNSSIMALRILYQKMGLGNYGIYLLFTVFLM